MRALFRLAIKRGARGKPSTFEIRGREIPALKVASYIRRKGITDLAAWIEEGDGQTIVPFPDVRCRTPVNIKAEESYLILKKDRALSEQDVSCWYADQEHQEAPDTQKKQEINGKDKHKRTRSLRLSSKPELLVHHQCHISPTLSSPLALRHVENVLTKTDHYCRAMYDSPRPSKGVASTFASAEPLFIFELCLGDGVYLLKNNSQGAFERLDYAFSQTEHILRANKVETMTHTFCVLQQLTEDGMAPLAAQLLKYLTSMADIVLDVNHPFKAVTSSMLQAPLDMRLNLAEVGLRKALSISRDVLHTRANTMQFNDRFCAELHYRRLYKEPDVRLEQVLWAREELYGKNSFQALWAQLLMAGDFLRQGLFEKGEEIYDHVLERAEMLQGRDRATLRLYSLSVLSVIIKHQAQVEARQSKERVASSLPFTIHSITRDSSEAEIKAFERAERLLVEASELAYEMYGTRHWDKT